MTEDTRFRARRPSANEINRDAAAVSYAVLGWHVFPVYHAVEGQCACGGDARCTPSKHPVARLAPHGKDSATRDVLKVARWWEEGDWNIGLALEPSRLMALDLDPRHGSDESFARLVDEIGELPSTLESRTGGGGQHLIFQSVDGRLRGKLAPGVEMIAKGYIVLPPSIHVSGGAYRWTEGRGPW